MASNVSSRSSAILFKNDRLEDIEPLLDLPALEFVNLLGNLINPIAYGAPQRGVIVLADALLLG